MLLLYLLLLMLLLLLLFRLRINFRMQRVSLSLPLSVSVCLRPLSCFPYNGNLCLTIMRIFTATLCLGEGGGGGRDVRLLLIMCAH